MTDAGVDANLGDSGTTDRESGFACRVRVSSDGPVRACAPAGRGNAEEARCVSAADCAAGFACVAEALAGLCRPYCCATEATCGAGSFCAERPLYSGVSDAAPSAMVPVCVPADNCSLGEPFPCPENETCRCSAETACTVVRADGTTSCLPPGDGKAGEACPCAWGYVCSRANDTCLKLCSTTSASAECGSGRCQAAGNLPSGWGVCTQASGADAG
jgi:hypothetical protein